MHALCTSMGASIYTKGMDYMQLATLHTLKVNYISQSHHSNSLEQRNVTIYYIHCVINSAQYTNSGISTRYLPVVLVFIYYIYYFAGILLNHNASKVPNGCT